MTVNTSYIIGATPRSGSFLLCEALINTGVVGGPGEYFWRGNEEGFRERWGVSDYSDYVQAAIRQGSTDNGVFGVKIMRNYLDDILTKMRALPQFCDRDLKPHVIFAELFPNIHYIWITRRDKVRQAISFEKAIQSGIWARPRKDPSQLEKPLEYRSDAIASHLKSIVLDESLWNGFFEKAGVTPHVVVYEHLAKHYEDTARSVLAYLDVPEPDPLMSKPRYMQRQSDALSEKWYWRFMEE
ncbi:hypothetical protein H8E77_11565 [bacterium]|nr:hypothetical protein [bacterium]